jgi:hypothetical protein
MHHKNIPESYLNSQVIEFGKLRFGEHTEAMEALHMPFLHILPNEPLPEDVARLYLL